MNTILLGIIGITLALILAGIAKIGEALDKIIQLMQK